MKAPDPNRGFRLLNSARHKNPSTSSTLDKPLAYDHLGTCEMRSEIANLSGNVAIEWLRVP